MTTEQPYSLRYAEPAEHETLLQLQRDSAMASPEYREVIRAHPDAIAIPLSSILEKRTRVAVRDGTIVGFSIVLPDAKHTAELDGLFVRPELAGQGLGRMLINDLTSLARNQSIQRIEVTANPRAIGFYERLGFFGDTKVATRFAPALRMHLDIDSPADSGDLYTERLRLMRMHFRDFQCFRESPAAHASRLGLQLGEMLEGLLQPESQDATVAIEWNSFWIVHRKTRTLIGGCGCRKFPDAAGAVEIAYGLAPAFQNKGLATEAARQLVDRAFRCPGTKTALAFTLPQENASTRVLTKCGFIQAGMGTDPDEGPVWRWEKPRPN